LNVFGNNNVDVYICLFIMLSQFDVKSTTTNKSFRPHQTFLRFEKNGNEVYLAFQPTNKRLGLTINVAEVKKHSVTLKVKYIQ
jgi:hypothetical protein